MKRCILMMIIAGVLAATPASAAACQPIDPGQYMTWYEPHIDIATDHLPAGVQIVSNGPTIDVTNTTEAPLFVLARGTPEPVADLMFEVPAGLSATHKLQYGAMYVWQDARWVSDGYTTAATFALDSAALSQPLHIDRQVGGDRPLNAAVPAPQFARMVFAYDDHLMTVPLTLSHALNPLYRPLEFQQANATPCGYGTIRIVFAQLFYSLLLWLTGLVLVVVIANWISKALVKEPS